MGIHFKCVQEKVGGKVLMIATSQEELDECYLEPVVKKSPHSLSTEYVEVRGIVELSPGYSEAEWQGDVLRSLNGLNGDLPQCKIVRLGGLMDAAIEYI